MTDERDSQERDGTVVGVKFCRRYDDGGERLAASFDVTARYFNDRVTIRANEADDSTVYVDFKDVRWLASALSRIADELPAALAKGPPMTAEASDG